MASTSRGTDQVVSFLARILPRMFGRPQGVLGRLGGIIMACMNRNLAGRTIALLDVQPHDRVLEIGFGPGVGIELLSGVVSSGHVAGVDVSEEMVEQARIRNVEAIQRGKVELRRGSVEALPFASEMFDKAMAINAMQVWPDAVAGLREIARVLKPGTSDARVYPICGATPGGADGCAHDGGIRRCTGGRHREGFLCVGDQILTDERTDHTLGR